MLTLRFLALAIAVWHPENHKTQNPQKPSQKPKYTKILSTSQSPRNQNAYINSMKTFYDKYLYLSLRFFLRLLHLMRARSAEVVAGIPSGIGFALIMFAVPTVVEDLAAGVKGLKFF